MAREVDEAAGDLRPRPRQLFSLALRTVSDGTSRGGAETADLTPADARALLHAWHSTMGIGDLIAEFSSAEFDHARLFNRARRLHERKLGEAVGGMTAALTSGTGYAEAGAAVFDAFLPVVPYAPAMSILAGEHGRLVSAEPGPRRVAVVVDGVGSTHGVAHVIERMRENGVDGYEVEVLGTDPRVDCRLPSVADIEVPFYEGATVGVPSLLDVVEALAEGEYDLVHIATPGPAGLIAAAAARVAGLPLVASHHTELVEYAGLRSGSIEVQAAMAMLMGTLYGQCELVLSPSPAADASLAMLGVDAEAIVRWGRGVDTDVHNPALRDTALFPPGNNVNVLHAGRLSTEKGIELLAESFLLAHSRDPRLHLCLAGDGPERAWLEGRLAAAANERGCPPLATFLGWLGRDDLARTYASADILMFCSRTDTYGQVIVEAQASGLPVVAVDEGGPASLIQHRRTGWLCRPEADSLATAVAELAASSFLRQKLAGRGLDVVRLRSWDACFEQLAIGWGLGFDWASRRQATPKAPAGDDRLRAA